MAYMCVRSHSLYNAKECDDCGRCEREDDFDELAWECDRDEAYADYYEREDIEHDN